MPAARIGVLGACRCFHPAHSSGGKPWARWFVRNLLAAAVYWGSAVLGQWYFAQYRMWPAPIWLPAGVTLYPALSNGRCSWPGIFLGALLTDSISFGEALGPAALLALANTIAPIVAAERIRNHISREQPFGRVKEAVAFGLGAFLHGMLAACVGALRSGRKHPPPCARCSDGGSSGLSRMQEAVYC